MEIDFMYHKDKTKPEFKEGDIIALRVDCDGIKTNIKNYYLIGLYNKNYYCLIDIKTGKIFTRQDYNGTRYLDKEDLTDLIEDCDGKVYQGNKAKLSLEVTK